MLTFSPGRLPPRVLWTLGSLSQVPLDLRYHVTAALHTLAGDDGDGDTAVQGTAVTDPDHYRRVTAVRDLLSRVWGINDRLGILAPRAAGGTAGESLAFMRYPVGSSASSSLAPPS